MNKKRRKLIERYLVRPEEKFRLRGVDPADTAGLDLKKEAAEILREGVEELSDLQDKLYAQDRWAVLLIFQAMDAAGKDGTIKHVMSGVNPQGCQVYSFKVPSSEELDHDFMWRTTKCLPERGRIGIFNRSYYEEVLVVRVHEEILAREKLSPTLVTPKIWEDRFRDINHFEHYLARNGTLIRKFFLHVSKKEQTSRLIARLDDPNKNWKFSVADAKEREFWMDYQRAYEEMIRETSKPWAPWYVVPADHKWFTRLVVGGAVIAALEDLDLSYPDVGPEQHATLQRIRRALAKK